MIERKISGILLAGGKSKRMGKDKAFINYLGKELYRYPLEILEHFCDDIIISTSNSLFLETGYKLCPDEISGIGPMGGIYTCLKETKHEYSLVLGCDTPLINHHIIRELIAHISAHSVVVAMNSEGFPESLIGIYKKTCSDSLKSRIEKQNFKMSDFLRDEKALFHNLSLPHSDLLKLFSNINTKQDLQSLPKYGKE